MLTMYIATGKVTRSLYSEDPKENSHSKACSSLERNQALQSSVSQTGLMTHSNKCDLQWTQLFIY